MIQLLGTDHHSKVGVQKLESVQEMKFLWQPTKIGTLRVILRGDTVTVAMMQAPVLIPLTPHQQVKVVYTNIGMTVKRLVLVILLRDGTIANPVVCITVNVRSTEL